uniref:receptor protein-tyrosine kinase n=1 Tax=Plectus sambesii TaxID=2011161 RepID=A0A914WQJ8_9BILA
MPPLSVQQSSLDCQKDAVKFALTTDSDLAQEASINGEPIQLYIMNGFPNLRFPGGIPVVASISPGSTTPPISFSGSGLNISSIYSSGNVPSYYLVHIDFLAVLIKVSNYQVTFNVDCLWTANTNANGTIVVNSSNSGSNSANKFQFLDFVLTNHANEPLQDKVVPQGTPVRVAFQLHQGYTLGLAPLQCNVSNENDNPVVFPVIYNGCPNWNLFDVNSNFEAINRTGPTSYYFEFLAYTTDNAERPTLLFIQCEFRFCVSGSDEECNPACWNYHDKTSNDQILINTRQKTGQSSLEGTIEALLIVTNNGNTTQPHRNTTTSNVLVIVLARIMRTLLNVGLLVIFFALVAIATGKDCPCPECALKKSKLTHGTLVRSNEPFYANDYLTAKRELISNASILLPLFLTIKGYEAKDFEIWHNDSSISVDWKPESHDAVIPFRYPPELVDANLWNLKEKIRHRKNSIAFVLRFSEINMFLRSTYELKIRSIFSRACKRMVKLDKQPSMTVVFACEKIENATCHESIGEQVDPVCGILENQTVTKVIETGTEMNVEIDFQVAHRLIPENLSDKILYYRAFFGKCHNGSVLSDYCRLEEIDGSVSTCEHDSVCNPNITSIVLPKLRKNETYGIQVCAILNHDHEYLHLDGNSELFGQIVPPFPEAARTDWRTEFALSGYIAIVISSCFVCICLLYRKRRKQTRKQLLLELQAFAESDPWEVRQSDLTIHADHKLGSGAFGTVYLGTLSPSYYELNPKQQVLRNNKVAVKLLHEHADASMKNDFLAEIQLAKSLGYHDRLVNLVGCITEGPTVCLISEYCAKGDMQKYLRERCAYMLKLQDLGIDFGSLPEDKMESVDFDYIVTQNQLLQYALHICLGLEYLADHNFIHRDVAARNVLVTERNEAKVGDFGLCRSTFSNDAYYRSRGGNLPVKWMPPEAIKHFEFSAKSDCWSFGIVLFELITLGGSPYPGIQPHDILGYLEKGYRMDKPDNCPDQL